MPRNAKTSTSPLSAVKRHRRAHWLRWCGYAFGFLGGGTALLGAILPWAQVAVFGLPLPLTGILTYGAICAATTVIGLLTLRNFPLIAVLAGVLGAFCALTTRNLVARDLMGRVISIERAIAPVNSRLAQVALEPIEPFEGIGPVSRYLGPGALIAAVGGFGLAAGGVLAFAGMRMQRSCGVCGSVWSDSRRPNFCPNCGNEVASTPLCRHCHAPLVKGDKFCVECGNQS